MRLADLAGCLGKSIATVSDYENGKTEPSLSDLELAAGFYNVSPAWLVLGLGEMVLTDRHGNTGAADAA